MPISKLIAQIIAFYSLTNRRADIMTQTFDLALLKGDSQ